MALVRRLGLAWLCCGLLLAPATQLGAVAGSEELQNLRQAIGESRERVGGFERHERELFDWLEEIHRRLDALAQQVKSAREAASWARSALQEAERRAEVAAVGLEETRRAMSRRVVALYKSGEMGPIHVLFSSTSPRELLYRISTLRSVVEYDVQLIARFRRDRDEFQAAQGAALAATAERDAALKRMRDGRREVSAERKTKHRLLARVRDDRVQERAMLVELEKAARALEETVRALGENPARRGRSLDGSGFGARRGSLRPPISARIVRGFGRVVDAEFLTQTFRKGVEFGAKTGESVRAVAPGEVRFGGWFRGYGKIVIVDHGDRYFTVYGHLSDLGVEVGAFLREGDRIGSSGETGSLTGPSLYFEIRQGSQPLDPASWFRGS
ncbi:MAG: peptidoglycan DD-metalloendopeptidase family protein, partial [Myxococcota bacterium]